MVASWEHFERDGNNGLRGLGATPAEAFEQAALALSAAIAAPDGPRAYDRIEVSCASPSPDLLLADWLNLLVYEMAVRKMLFTRFSVNIAGDRLFGMAWGHKIDPLHPPLQVKAAIYSGLKVEQRPDGVWLAECGINLSGRSSVMSRQADPLTIGRR